MKIRYKLTIDYDIDDEVIKEWAESAIEYNYPNCISDNLEQCVGEDYYMNTDRINVINYESNFNDIVEMVKTRGKILLTNPKETV
jgi:hypothetical protein